MRLTKRAKSFLSKAVKFWAEAEKEGIPIDREAWRDYRGSFCHAGVLGLKFGGSECDYFSDSLNKLFVSKGAPKKISCPACDSTHESFLYLCTHLNSEYHKDAKKGKFTFLEAAKLLNKKYELGVKL